MCVETSANICKRFVRLQLVTTYLVKLLRRVTFFCRIIKSSRKPLVVDLKLLTPTKSACKRGAAAAAAAAAAAPSAVVSDAKYP